VDVVTSEYCEREQDVLDAVTSGRWPARGDEELRAHVTACDVCSDLAEVAAAVIDDRDAAWTQARVPSAGMVWWRAQLRAREDAARAAGRPVAFIQGVAASVALWLIVSLVRALPAEYLSNWRTWVSSVVPSFAFTMADVARVTAAVPLVVFILVAVWLVLAPVAIYFAAADE
jgi:hypothetical protein